ncbi:hypothetical protein LTR28_006906 [Elasticomyces elasticus]|nr:hypothetical protein LTR28_006906 [Elasticomyces elasticus]
MPPATAPPLDGRPYVTKGGDKTQSWVHSINEEPPPPPPVEASIVDAPVHFGAVEDDRVPADEPTAREMQSKKRRDSRYGPPQDDPDDHRRRRREEKRDERSRRDGEGIRSSDGSAGDRRSRAFNSLGYGDMASNTFDGRPAAGGKRGSWFKKIAGF